MKHPQSHLALLQVLMKDDQVKVVECTGAGDTSFGGRKMRPDSLFGGPRSDQMILLDQSPCASTRGDGNTSPSGYESEEFCGSTGGGMVNSSRIISPYESRRRRLIGSVPIAEYEGSPKRYGLKPPTQAMPTHFDLVDVDLAGGNNGMTVHTVGDANAGGERTNTASALNLPPTNCSSSASLDSNTYSISCSAQNIVKRGAKGSPSNSCFPVKTVPGFPQRVTVCDFLKNEPTKTKGLSRECHHHRLEENLHFGDKCSENQQVVLLGALNEPLKCGNGDNSPDDSVASQKGSNNTTNSGSFDTDSTTAAEQCAQQNARELGLLTNYMDPSGSSGSNAYHPGDSSVVAPNSSSYSNENLDAEYMMEFSETRKVLEEFFRVSDHKTAAGGKDHHFDELNYTLKRQAGNSYVGQRLASETAVDENPEDSPKKAVQKIFGAGASEECSSDGGKLSPKLISFQEVANPSPLLCAPSSGATDCHYQSSGRRTKSPRSQSRSPLKSPCELQGRDVNDNDMDGESGSTNTDGDVENAPTLIHVSIIVRLHVHEVGS